jgi:hypothetical protein
MWCNQCFGSDIHSRSRVGKQFYNIVPQLIRLRRIKAAGDCRSPDNHDCGPACTLPGLQLITMSKVNSDIT